MTLDVAPSGSSFRLSPLTSPLLGQARHGFFTREGGVSTGPYASLNCSTRSGDTPENLAENRQRVAAHMGVAPAHLLGVTQVHGANVITAEQPWAPGAGAQADALVTTRPDLALGVITADCAPVLFSTSDGTVVGAAHAGWRGALAGVLEATLAAMGHLGATATDIKAVVGPCIAQESYETGADMRATILAGDRQAAIFFAPGLRPGHYQFDLAGWCVFRLQRAGIGRAAALGMDTLSDERRFFSHRRRTLAGGGPIGHQISVIATGPRPV
ncbi:peptidoglycan editing factor PgeF [Acetobacter sp. TBRC 12305]|uniref:Purine nucleoside phosphorylase n=1 Tax=Acetobacter garciniae TaxID=2817435 RepID=A0A939KRJ0_9PROT|nr:peptidoglycan editing factor PgeF [Acetobacter garciniae]MBO1325211.1 peptidoglycan editing factor PgeF [Acetobacter garciniae]MBX0344818.1 peptidoglycan editing factor PgeF [Acetobacter garciniae]